MLQRLFGFLVVFLLMFQGNVLGQEKFIVKQFISQEKRAAFKLKFSKTELLTYDSSMVINKYNLMNITKTSYYANHLGFFCQKELQLEKITNVPIRFRLGSLDYVNWMEGKPNAIKPR